MSAELETLSENRERFESVGTAVSVSRTEALKIANDKLKLFNFLRNSGIACADFIQVDSVASLRDAVYSMGYPAKRVCVKAPSGSGSRGFRVLDSERRGLDSFLHEKPDSACISFDSFLEYFEGCEDFPDLMVMEFLPGTEYTVDLLADNGKVLYSCCRKSLGLTNSIMLDGMTVDNPAVTTLCESVVKKLGLDGNIGFDLKERADGTVLIMECNPRITAGIPFFKAAGVNLPYLCIKKLLGEPMPELEMTTGLKMKRRYCEMYCGT